MNNDVDANAVIQKLQARLGEAMTIIAVLESRLEASQIGSPDEDDNPSPLNSPPVIGGGTQ